MARTLPAPCEVVTMAGEPSIWPLVRAGSTVFTCPAGSAKTKRRESEARRESRREGRESRGRRRRGRAVAEAVGVHGVEWKDLAGEVGELLVVLKHARHRDEHRAVGICGGGGGVAAGGAAASEARAQGCSLVPQASESSQGGGVQVMLCSASYGSPPSTRRPVSVKLSEG